MIANFKINIKNFNLTSSTVTIPVNVKYQFVDNDELIQRVFVDNEVKKSVNCILDYDKTKFTPFFGQKEVVNIRYKINLLDKTGNYKTPSYLSDLLLNKNDLETSSNSFLNGFLFLQFYDDYNPQTRNFLTESQIYNFLYPDLALENGLIKDPTQIPIEYIASNSKMINDGQYTAFYVYDDIDKYKKINSQNSLYCSAQLFNAKTGKVISLMTTKDKPKIDELPLKQFMKFNLIKNNNGFTYTIDNSFNNIEIVPTSDDILNTKDFKDIIINLYETRVN